MTLGSHPSAAPAPYRMLDTRVPHDDIDARGPGAELVTADGRALPLRGATLKAEAAGGIARVVLEQTFENVYDDTLAVIYKMPLPADGAVSGYTFEIGGRIVKGFVEPKAKARATFEAAIAEGRTAALLEQQKSDIFTQEIGNIPGKAAIIARITVDQRLAWLPEGEWELRFPTVIGPRYVGATETAADARAVSVSTSEAPLPVRLALDVHVKDALAPGRRVESPSHALDTTGSPDGRRVSLRAKDGARLDRDVVVRWCVARPSVGATLVTGAKDGAAYGLLTLVPPSPEARIAPVPRDLVVLLDTSGSMNGAPLDLAKRVVSQILDSLDERDQFEVIEFGTRPNRYHAEPLAGTTARKRDAVRWVMGRKADGGTEMYAAVLEALRAMRPGAQRQVVLVTDGYIGGEQQIVRLCHEKLPASCRLHVVGVGSAANRALATALSRAGRGAEILVGVGEDAERASKRLLDRTAAPILTDVVIEGAFVKCAPEHLPDVFVGSPLVCALFLSPGGGEITIRGNLAHGAWSQRVRVPATKDIEENGAIAALYGRERVADLETTWSIGQNQQRIDKAIERVGVDFQIATRLTSWVAVDQTKQVDPYAPSRSESVPQELPYGTTMGSFGAAAAPQAMSMMASTRAGTIEGGASFEALMARAKMLRAEAADADEEDQVRSLARTTDAPTAMRPAPAPRPAMSALPPSAPAPESAAPTPGAGAPPPPAEGSFGGMPPQSMVDLAAHAVTSARVGARKGRSRVWLFVLFFVIALVAALVAWFLLAK